MFTTIYRRLKTKPTLKPTFPLKPTARLKNNCTLEGNRQVVADSNDGAYGKYITANC